MITIKRLFLLLGLITCFSGDALNAMERKRPRAFFGSGPLTDLGETSRKVARTDLAAETVGRWFESISLGDSASVSNLMHDTPLGISTKDGGCIDICNGDRLTGLMVAILAKNYSIVSLLIKAGADVKSEVPPLYRGTLDTLIIYAACLPYRAGWDVEEICGKLLQDDSALEFKLGEAFKWACHCPAAATVDEAYSEYKYNVAHANERDPGRPRRSEQRIAPNPLLVDFLAKKLGLSI